MKLSCSGPQFIATLGMRIGHPIYDAIWRAPGSTSKFLVCGDPAVEHVIARAVVIDFLPRNVSSRSVVTPRARVKLVCRLSSGVTV